MLQAGKSKKGVTVTKDDIRRLMKEKKKTEGSIESPLAKYNSLGHLICIVCNNHVKSDKLWNAHILGRTHKENVEKLKSSAASLSAPAESLKRKTIPSDESVSKKSKEEDSSAAPSKPLRGILKGPHVEGADSSDTSSSEDSDDKDSQAQSRTSMLLGPSVGTSALPANFYDTEVECSLEVNDKNKKLMVRETPDTLPEGFFDDPKLDAKARHVEYRDKAEDEWESFQKAIKEETHISELISAEDEFVNTEERHLEEIDEQMSRWSRVDKMCKQKERLVEQQTATAIAGASGGDCSDQSDEEIPAEFNWRSKNAIK